jgi:hypothetical protein
MKIASKRTLDDMDIAAELREHGAIWDTIAQMLCRHKRVDALGPLLLCGLGAAFRDGRATRRAAWGR